MKTPQPNKTLKGVQVHHIEYLAVIDPDYRDEYASDNDMDEDDVQQWIEALQEETEIFFTLTDEELDNCDDEDELEELLRQCIEDETGEYFEGYEWEFIYQEDLVDSE